MAVNSYNPKNFLCKYCKRELLVTLSGFIQDTLDACKKYLEHHDYDENITDVITATVTNYNPDKSTCLLSFSTGIGPVTTLEAVENEIKLIASDLSGDISEKIVKADDAWYVMTRIAHAANRVNKCKYECINAITRRSKEDEYHETSSTVSVDGFYLSKEPTYRYNEYVNEVIKVRNDCNLKSGLLITATLIQNCLSELFLYNYQSETYYDCGKRNKKCIRYFHRWENAEKAFNTHILLLCFTNLIHFWDYDRINPFMKKDEYIAVLKSYNPSFRISTIHYTPMAAGGRSGWAVLNVGQEDHPNGVICAYAWEHSEVYLVDLKPKVTTSKVHNA